MEILRRKAKWNMKGKRKIMGKPYKSARNAQYLVRKSIMANVAINNIAPYMAVDSDRKGLLPSIVVVKGIRLSQNNKFRLSQRNFSSTFCTR